MPARGAGVVVPYRKLIVELAARGLRGIAFDLPGLGLAERPAAFDYTWTALAGSHPPRSQSLDLDRFHLVVHDIGAPVGFELAAAHPGRVASLTVLNAPVEVDTFHRPWVMKPFAVKRLGEVYLRAQAADLPVADASPRRCRPQQDHDG